MPLIAPSTQAKSRQPIPWFSIGMAGIFLFSLLLRFWGLGRFNTLVFDEVYYAKFASAFLKGETVFTGHPPFSTYIIAIGIWIGRMLPWGHSQPQNELAGLLLSPFSYRWLNALTGSFIPLVVGAIAYQLSRRRSYAFLAALLIALDGLFLVESRYALNNVYLVLFGLLGHLWLLIALKRKKQHRWFYLILAGIGFGAAGAIKWNGWGFLLGAYGVWAIAWLVEWSNSIRDSFLPRDPEATRRGFTSPLQHLTQLHLGHIFISFALVPAFTYYLSWVPYMLVDPSDGGFLELQAQTMDYHKRVGGLEAHPYCSLWYSWPLMQRPVAYFYEMSQGGSASAAIINLPRPAHTATPIYDVHAMGNPPLWWFSTVAVGLFLLFLGYRCWQVLRGRLLTQPSASAVPSSPRSSALPPNSRASGWRSDRSTGSPTVLYSWTIAYLLINWGANLLPWVSVTRCLFIYHYMPALVFAVLLLALLIDRWLHSAFAWQRIAAIALVFLIAAGLLFWLPLFLGLPLSPEGIALRRWFNSWI